jgi:proton-translocating NAD(P)+ transhydrogenase subunit alpha
MKVGVPQETIDGERRVALVPEGVAKLRDRGLEVLVESGAGRDFNLDEAYAEAGAEVVDAERLYSEADLVAKVRAPTEAEAERLRDGQLVVSFLPPVPSAELIAHLAERGVTAVSMDAVPRIARAQTMDALSSQSSVAGYKCVLIGADALGKYVPMMTTAAGTTKAAKVLVLGAGVAGLQAIATARRLGADITAFDIRPEVKEQIESLGATFLEEGWERSAAPVQQAAPRQQPRAGLAGLWDELKLAVGMGPGDAAGASADGAGGEGQQDERAQGSATTGGYATEQAEDKQRRDRELIKGHVANTDLVITTALIPGRPAPTLLTADMVEAMPPGSVVVDLAAEAGGNCELTRAGETVEHNQVRIMGPRDIPSGMPVHASQFYSRNVINLLSHLVGEDGELELDFDDEITDGVVVCHGSEVRHQGAREALGAATEKAEA